MFEGWRPFREWPSDFKVVPPVRVVPAPLPFSEPSHLSLFPLTSLGERASSLFLSGSRWACTASCGWSCCLSFAWVSLLPPILTSPFHSESVTKPGPGPSSSPPSSWSHSSQPVHQCSVRSHCFALKLSVDSHCLCLTLNLSTTSSCSLPTPNYLSLLFSLNPLL